jgi:hypothetical protein
MCMHPLGTETLQFSLRTDTTYCWGTQEAFFSFFALFCSRAPSDPHPSSTFLPSSSFFVSLFACVYPFKHCASNKSTTAGCVCYKCVCFCRQESGGPPQKKRDSPERPFKYLEVACHGVFVGVRRGIATLGPTLMSANKLHTHDPHKSIVLSSTFPFSCVALRVML